MRPQPLIAVADVEASSRWYQAVLGARSGHGGTEYERILVGDELVLQLHDWDVDHHHRGMGDPGDRPYGNGVLLWFETDDFDAAVGRARRLGAEIVQEPHVNPNARHRECWVRDLDGYVVVLSSPDGEADRPPAGA
jgi:catechol 2,3-dioxygenase-like lactoylglutathione lyase family enzyme